jgi:hypothetical protein
VILDLVAICAYIGPCTVAWEIGDANSSLLDGHDFQAEIGVFEPQGSVLDGLLLDAGTAVQEPYANEATVVPHSAFGEAEIKD